MTTIFTSKIEELPPTSDMKMIDFWLIFTLIVPFLEVIIRTSIECVTCTCQICEAADGEYEKGTANLYGRGAIAKEERSDKCRKRTLRNCLKFTGLHLSLVLCKPAFLLQRFGSCQSSSSLHWWPMLSLPQSSTTTMVDGPIWSFWLSTLFRHHSVFSWCLMFWYLILALKKWFYPAIYLFAQQKANKTYDNGSERTKKTVLRRWSIKKSKNIRQSGQSEDGVLFCNWQKWGKEYKDEYNNCKKGKGKVWKWCHLNKQWQRHNWTVPRPPLNLKSISKILKSTSDLSISQVSQVWTSVFYYGLEFPSPHCTMRLSVALRIWNIWKCKGLLFAQFWSNIHQSSSNW